MTNKLTEIPKNKGDSLGSSIEDIYDDYIFFNNYIPGIGKNMLYNNYLITPTEKERIRKVIKINEALKPLASIEYVQYGKKCNHSQDDINNPNKYDKK